ncbi:G-protein coupled receptor 55 [Nothobranchius furzeri]|uniref:G-protein coupled receptor 55-like n=1 Tax=Nothobranchius furzeri TaxID=105023 RepID=A0A8C6MIS1_NOTFU|nr:G-protein coupled receptor 55 [Nothobranchius furzeri]KAF7222773.1 G-protein coupled receptor 55-like [Nothobranchius furzeri]
MCTNISFSPNCTVGTFELVAYSPVFLVGFLVNVAALRAFISKWKLWTNTHIYMLNLAIADFILILSLPFRIYDTFFCLPVNSLCTFLMNLHFINMYASIMTTTAISVHRYVVIKFPLHVRSWRRRKETAVAVCQIFWILLVTLAVVFREENSPEKLWTCYERRKCFSLSLKFVLLLVLCGFFIPLLIVVFCSSQIIYVMLKRRKRSEEQRSIIGIVTANMIVFLVCYTPLHVAFVVNYFHKFPLDPQRWNAPVHMYLRVSEWIASTNCCFDSISYYFLLKKFYT